TTPPPSSYPLSLHDALPISDEAAAFASLQRFAIQRLHLAQARRCALLQRRASRRMGENDAWLVATADSLNADVVGADRAAFERRSEERRVGKASRRWGRWVA